MDSNEREKEEEIIELTEIVGLDQYGHLKYPEKWNKDWAEWMAKREGINQLTKQQWQGINFIRRYYQEKGQAPGTEEIAKAVGIELNEFIDFFPPRADAMLKIAGLPRSELSW